MYTNFKERPNFTFDHDSLEFCDYSNLRTTIKFNKKHCLDSSDDSLNLPSSTNEKTIMKDSFPQNNQNTNISVCRKLNFGEDESNHDSLKVLKTNSNETIDSNDGSFLLIRRKSSTNFGLKHPKFDEDYVTIKTLSKGENGTVFLCFKSKDSQVYAVKVTKEFSTKKDYQIMLDFVVCLSSNNEYPTSFFILNYTDFWLEDDEDSLMNSNSLHYKAPKNLYIVNNYCSNGNLIDYMERLKLFQYNFNSNFFYDIVFEMLCAVMHLHKVGYIHFDIKPTNFLINEHGNIKLTDFCLSRSQNYTINNPSDLPEGDDRYLSPELFAKKDVTYKTDIFSLGLSFLEILTQFNLPKNGLLWRQIREVGIPSELLDKITNIVDKNMIQNLILNMTNVNPNLRCNIESILNDNINYPMFYSRYMNLLNGQYKNMFDPFNWKGFVQGTIYDYSCVQDIQKNFAKRSDSTKFSFYTQQ